MFVLLLVRGAVRSKEEFGVPVQYHGLDALKRLLGLEYWLTEQCGLSIPPIRSSRQKSKCWGVTVAKVGPESSSTIWTPSAEDTCSSTILTGENCGEYS